MTSSRRLRAAVAAALSAVIALTLAACTASADKPTAATGPTGGTLRVAITAPGSVHPGNAYEPAGRLINELTCEPLLALDPETGEVKPALATTWIISNGGRRITLRLRKANFADGTRVTADHVVRSLSRAASEEFAGNTAALLEPVAGFAEISGTVETKRERDRRRLRGLTVIDRSSLSIDLSRRDADFLRVLAHPIAAPTVDGDEANPTCAGPYRLERPWERGQTTIRLVRNEHYHGAHPAFSNGGRGYPDIVEFVVTADAAKADVAAVTFAQAQTLNPQDRHEAPSGHIDYVGLPLTAFGDPAVRRAFSEALDRAVILEGRPPADGFLPGERCEPSTTRRPSTTDPLKLYFHDDFANRAIAAAIAEQWKANLGITATPTPIPFDDLARKAAGPEGVDGAFLMGWQPAAPRPDAYLAPLFTSAGIGSTNLSRFVDPDFDRILEREARGATEEEDSALGYQAAHEALCEAMPMIPVVQGMSRWRIDSARVAGATLDEARGQPVLRELYLREGAS